MTRNPDPLKFAVLYMGARMHYAVPALLAREGMLERFYTDVVAPSYARHLEGLHHFLPRRAVRLLGRRLPAGLRREQVAQSPWALIAEQVGKWSRSRGFELGVPSTEEWLHRRVLREHFHGANVFYTLTNADLELAREAKRRGLKVVTEQMINPHVGLIMREERRRFPGVERNDTDAEVLAGIERDVELWQLSDLILAPSDFVRSEILEHGIPPERVALVPYGIDEAWLATETTPVPGRVLFVGSVGLRKGAHYLAAATRELKRRRVPVEVRVVGPVSEPIRQREEFLGPEYVGQVPRSMVRDEFRRADVFVLPTLAEGMALVHLEALACGLPVITTPNCGSVVREGVDGFVVPIRDSQALADRIQTVLEDRQKRAELSRNARLRAALFTWKNYQGQLLEALRLLRR